MSDFGSLPQVLPIMQTARLLAGRLSARRRKISADRVAERADSLARIYRHSELRARAGSHGSHSRILRRNDLPVLIEEFNVHCNRLLLGSLVRKRSGDGGLVFRGAEVGKLNLVGQLLLLLVHRDRGVSERLLDLE